jgi:hypothetical protein
MIFYNIQNCFEQSFTNSKQYGTDDSNPVALFYQQQSEQELVFNESIHTHLPHFFSAF